MEQQQEKGNEKFFIGLDIGTESVGFSATDGNYNLLKVGGKPIMGVRLFEEAKTSAERRIFRANKVRKDRQKQRTMLLQSLFNDEISKIDPLFFIRLEASSFWEEDKNKRNKTDKKLSDLNSLFADKKFTDATYFKKFKTIYHLREHLMTEKNWTGKTKPDIRLLYLACHHILKSRGHFLWSAEEINYSVQGQSSFKKLNDCLETALSSEDEINPIQLTIPSNFNSLLVVFQAKLGLKSKQEELKKILFADANKKNNKIINAMLKAITGGNFNLNDIFDAELEKEESIYSFDNDWDEIASKITNALNNDDQFAVVESLKDVYDFGQLNLLLQGHASISSAMISKFNEHKEDLEILKKFVRKVIPHEYNKIFRSNKEYEKTTKSKLGNYANYIGSNLVDGKTIVKKVEKAGFYEFLLNVFADNKLIERGKEWTITTTNLTEQQYETLDKILKKINQSSYMLKSRTKYNAIIPYQLHKYELETMLSNAENHYEFLKKVDNDKHSTCKTVKDKILSLISFRVPYYVGRLNNHSEVRKGMHAWVEKKLKGVKITPWTFDAVVDKNTSAEKFIERMLSKCTYLPTEPVLPKYSLVYSEFCVLNELNKLKIRGNDVTVEIKQGIFNNLFKQQRNITPTKLLNYLKITDNTLTKEDLSGFDKEGKGFNSSLCSLIDTSPIIDALQKSPYNKSLTTAQKIIEKVIQWHALFEDKKILESKMGEEYPFLKGDIAKQLKSLNYSGFGNLSKEFLTSEKVICKDTGELISILRLLWETNENLNEIIWNKNYNIQEWLAKENNTSDKEFSYADIAESYGSPSVKRSVWEAMKIVDEIISFNNNLVPDKIFIEVTRREDEKQRSITRKKYIEGCWKNAKTLSAQVINELKSELESKTDAQLRSEKLFLYFMQCGRCAYSGEKIMISDLANNNLYDIDHIIPQSLVKDDSIKNKVLAKKYLNGKKDKNYPLYKTNEIWSRKDSLLPMWRSWQKAGLISPEKFNRLTRTNDITEREMEGFIARQLVFTGQSATLTASLFKKKFNSYDKQPEIVYSKADNVSEFRNKVDMEKCREVNDLHHAHDAYLNIVVGNVYNERFNHNKNFYKSQTNKFQEYNTNRMFEYNVKNAWDIDLNTKPKRNEFSDEDKESYQKAVISWLKNQEIVKKIKNVISKNYYPVTKKLLENKGAFYDQTLYGVEIKQKEIKRGKVLLKIKDTSLPLKGNENNPLSNIQRYGYFTSENPAYFIIVEHTVSKGTGKNKKENRVRQFVTLPLIKQKQWEREFSLVKSKIDKENFFNEKLTNYLIAENGFKDLTIVLPKVYKYTLFEESGTPMRISGLKDRQNAVQWYVDDKTISYVRVIYKYAELVKKGVLKEDDYKNQSTIIVSAKKNGLPLSITLDKNKDLFVIIKSQLEKDIYKGNSALYKKLDQDNEQKFNKLDIVNQVKILTELIRALACNAQRGDIKSIGGHSAFGRLVNSDKIENDLVLIEESITGLKTKHTRIYPF